MTSKGSVGGGGYVLALCVTGPQFRTVVRYEKIIFNLFKKINVLGFELFLK